MTLVNNVTRLLTLKGIIFESHELPEEKLGALAAAAFLGVAENQVYKSIVLLDETSAQSILALVPGNKKADLKAIGKLLASKRIRAASQSQAEKLTALKSGGISALALIDKKFKIIIDEKSLSHNKIIVSGGQRGLNISMRAIDLIHLCNAKIGKISS